MFLRTTIHPKQDEAPGAGGGGGGGEAPWATLPDDLRPEVEATGFKGVEDLAKGYLNAQRRLGVAIPIPDEGSTDEARAEFRAKLAGLPGVALLPGENASDEDRAAFYAKLGRPEKADDYKLDEIPTEAVVEYLGEAGAGAYKEQQAAFQSSFRQAAHQAGLSASQVQHLAKWWNDTQVEGIQAEVQGRQAAQREVEKLLGTGKQYETSRVQIDRFIDKFVGEEMAATLRSELDRTKLGNTPALALLLYKASAATLEEDELVHSDKPGGASDTQFEIERQLETITGDLKHPYYNRAAEGHDAAVRKVTELNEQLRKLKGQPEFVRA